MNIGIADNYSYEFIIFLVSNSAANFISGFVTLSFYIY